MRSIATISFNSRWLRWDDVENLFRSVGLIDLANVGESPTRTYLVSLDADSSAKHGLVVGLNALGIGFNMRLEEQFSFSELMEYELIKFSLMDRAFDDGGPRYGTKYDLTAGCEKCGTGAVQISPLVVDGRKIPKRRQIVWTRDFEYLVSTELKLILEQLSLGALEMWQVIDKNDFDLLPWWQLRPSFVLPKMASCSEGVVKDRTLPSCSSCLQDGFFFSARIPARIRYEPECLRMDNLEILNLTWERFGSSEISTPFYESHFAAPMLVCKPLFLRVLKEHRISNWFGIPVLIEDC